MPDSNPYDMDVDGEVDSVDFLGSDYVIRYGSGCTPEVRLTDPLPAWAPVGDSTAELRVPG